MAHEELDPSAAQPAPPRYQRPIDFDDPENEDLFDFEDLSVCPAGHVPPGEEELSTAQESPDRAPSVERAVEQPSEQTLQQPAPEQGRPPAPLPVTADGDLDHDLFDFERPAGYGPEPEAPGVPSDRDAQPASAAADTAELDPFPAPAPAPQSAASTGSTAAASRSRSSRRPLPAPRGASIDDLANFELPDELPLPRRRGRLIELLAVSFLLLNTALIAFAWRAGDDFEHTLAAITRTLANAVDRGPGATGPTGATGATTDPTTTPTGTDPSGGSTSAAGGDPDQEPSAIESFHELALRIGKQHMAAGAHAEGRRSLYQMLANHDRAVVSPELVAEAEFLIARSYKLEAQALVEDAR